MIEFLFNYFVVVSVAYIASRVFGFEWFSFKVLIGLYFLPIALLLLMFIIIRNDEKRNNSY